MRKEYMRIFLSLCIIFSGISELRALGVLYVRPRFSNQQYDKMWIKSVNVDVDIQDQVAVTHVDQIFYNEMNTSVETIYIFPLPENGMITELVYWFNGERYVADIRERQDAVSAYNEKLRQWLDPALLEYLGDNLYRLSIVPVNAQSEVRTEITYVELLNYDFGKTEYTFLLNTVGLSPKPLETVSLDLNAESQTSYKYFQSPTHHGSSATQINKISDTHYTLFFGDEDFYPDSDLMIEFETVREDVDFNVLTYTPAPEDSFGTDSYYALWITPPDSISEEEIIPKNIVFTADVSSSMEGNRIGQVKQSLEIFLDLLNPEDRFNIVTFGTFVEKFKPDLVSATSGNISQAHDFVFQLYALGMTNIDSALSASLKQSYENTASNNLIFLTDGYPTFGETVSDSILAHGEKNNKMDVRIFSFGIGEDISRSLLVRLARENHGYPTFITSDDSIALVVNNHFTRISKPVLTDLDIDLSGLSTYDVYPKVLEDLFWGSQVMQLGLYTNSGSFDITLSGKIRSESVGFTESVTFTDTLGGHRFVPRLWAKAKIDYLLELIEIYGETDELVNQVIELSLRYQILTVYTAFYSDPDDPGTGVDDNKLIVQPELFTLYQNYPNPFNSETKISFEIKNKSLVVLQIVNVMGQCIQTLVNQNQPAGKYTVTWDGMDHKDQIVPSGIYICRLECTGSDGVKRLLSRKMSLIR